MAEALFAELIDILFLQIVFRVFMLRALQGTLIYSCSYMFRPNTRHHQGSDLKQLKNIMFF